MKLQRICVNLSIAILIIILASVCIRFALISHQNIPCTGQNQADKKIDNLISAWSEKMQDKKHRFLTSKILALRTAISGDISEIAPLWEEIIKINGAQAARDVLRDISNLVIIDDILFFSFSSSEILAPKEALKRVPSQDAYYLARVGRRKWNSKEVLLSFCGPFDEALEIVKMTKKNDNMITAYFRYHNDVQEYAANFETNFFADTIGDVEEQLMEQINYHSILRKY